MQAHATTPPEIVAFGDSLTWGAGSGSTLGTGTSGPTGHGTQGDSYPAQLAELTGRTVVNQGICGDMITAATANDPVNAVTRFGDLMTRFPEGTIFVIEIGINDIAAGKASNLVADGYEKMLWDAATAHDPVFVTTITPGNWAKGSKDEIAREQVNTWIRTKAAAAGVTGVIDTEHAVSGVWAGTSVPVVYQANGQTINPNSARPHLNPLGYAAMAEAVFNGVVHPAKTEPGVTY
jgi:lysophospholipase L1-like esterase